MSIPTSIKDIIIRKYSLNEISYGVFEECLRNMPIKLELIDNNVYYISTENGLDNTLKIFNPVAFMKIMTAVQTEEKYEDRIKKLSRNLEMCNFGYTIDRLRPLYISKKIKLLENKIAALENSNTKLDTSEISQVVDDIKPETISTNNETIDTNILTTSEISQEQIVDNIKPETIPTNNEIIDTNISDTTITTNQQTIDILDLMPYVAITANIMGKIFGIFHQYQHKNLPKSLNHNGMIFDSNITEDQICTLIKHFTLFELRELLLASMASILMPMQKIWRYENLYTNDILSAINIITDTIKIYVKKIEK